MSGSCHVTCDVCGHGWTLDYPEDLKATHAFNRLRGERTGPDTVEIECPERRHVTWWGPKRFTAYRPDDSCE